MSEIKVTIPMLIELCKQEQTRQIPKDPSYKSGYREAFQIMESLLGRVVTNYNVFDISECAENAQTSELLNKLEQANKSNKELVEFMRDSCVWLDKIKTTIESIIHNCNAVLIEVGCENAYNDNISSYLEQIQYQDKINDYIDRLKNIFENYKE